MRRLAAALLVAAAFAGSPLRASAEDGAAAERLTLRALNQSEMLESMDAADDQPAVVPLGGRKVSVLLTRKEGGGAVARPSAATDAEGRFEVPLDGVARGDTLSLRIDPDAEGAPMYACLGLDPFRAPPAETADFYRVARSASPLAFDNLFLTVLKKSNNDDGSQPYVRINVIATVANVSPELWLGAGGRPALELPLPPGFEVIAVHRGGVDTRDFRVGQGHGGRPSLEVGGVFLPSIREPEMFRAVLTGPWQEEPYEFDFHAEVPIGRFQLNLEEGVFAYTGAPDGVVVLTDAGPNPPIQGASTHGWAAQDLAPHATVGARFRVGAQEDVAVDRPVDPKVKLVVWIIALVVAGALLLGFALAVARRGGRPAAKGVPAAVPQEDAAAKIRDLERRRDRGEITSFEFAARKAALEGRGGRARPAEKPAPRREDDALRTVEEIEARAGRADPAQLRRDVKTLADLLRRRLRG